MDTTTPVSQIIADYLDAFKLANPEAPLPELVDLKNGWIGMKLRHGYVNYRKSRIIVNTERLRQRILHK